MDISETSSVVVVLSYKAYDYVLNKYKKNVKFSHFYSSKRRSNIKFATSTRINLPLEAMAKYFSNRVYDWNEDRYERLPDPVEFTDKLVLVNEKHIFSSFRPGKVFFKGCKYNCLEQAYQHTKAKICNSDIAERIMALNPGYEIRELANQIKTTPEWDKCHLRVMRDVLDRAPADVKEFFAYQNAIGTTDGFIVEATPDLYWSAGLTEKELMTTPSSEWPGENMMGRLLMERRNIRQEEIKNRELMQKATTEAASKATATVGPKCNWCYKVKELLSGKKFCQGCGEQGIECAHCHRPMPERYYNLTTRTTKKLCDCCHRKYYKQAAKRKNLIKKSVYPLPAKKWIEGMY